MQKIVKVMGLFFKPKEANNLSQMASQSDLREYAPFSIGVNNLQEYIVDEHNKQFSNNNVPDFSTNQDLTMNQLSFQSNTTVKEYRIGNHFDKNLECSSIYVVYLHSSSFLFNNAENINKKTRHIVC